MPLLFCTECDPQREKEARHDPDLAPSWCLMHLPDDDPRQWMASQPHWPVQVLRTPWPMPGAAHNGIIVAGRIMFPKGPLGATAVEILRDPRRGIHLHDTRVPSSAVDTLCGSVQKTRDTVGRQEYESSETLQHLERHFCRTCLEKSEEQG